MNLLRAYISQTFLKKLRPYNILHYATALHYYTTILDSYTTILQNYLFIVQFYTKNGMNG